MGEFGVCSVFLGNAAFDTEFCENFATAGVCEDFVV